MKKEYKAPLLEVLKLIVDESLCAVADSPGKEGETEIPGDNENFFD